MDRRKAPPQVQVNFRMPSDLKERIERAALENGRTTTKEIVAALEEKFPSPARLEEIYAAEIIGWSDRIMAERGSDLGDEIMNDANDWLKAQGLTATEFMWVRVEGTTERFPATVRKLSDSEMALSFMEGDLDASKLSED